MFLIKGDKFFPPENVNSPETVRKGKLCTTLTLQKVSRMSENVGETETGLIIVCTATMKDHKATVNVASEEYCDTGKYYYPHFKHRENEIQRDYDQNCQI